MYRYDVPNPSAEGLPESSIPKLFERDGIIVIPKFASPVSVRTPAFLHSISDSLPTFVRSISDLIPTVLVQEEVAGMKGQMASLIDAWDPADSKGSVFHTYGSTRINQVWSGVGGGGGGGPGQGFRVSGLGCRVQS